jgi:hypothetical protein
VAFVVFLAFELFVAFELLVALELFLAFELLVAFELFLAFRLFLGNGLPGVPLQLGSSSSALDGFACGSFGGATELRPDPDTLFGPVCVPTKV